MENSKYNFNKPTNPNKEKRYRAGNRWTGYGWGEGQGGVPLAMANSLAATDATCTNTKHKNDIKNIKVVQVNLNKSNSAMQELTIGLRKEKDFICMITEPSVIKNRLSGIPKHYNSIPMNRENSPRAAIYTSQTIPIQEISNLGNRDLTVGLITHGSKQTAIISAYMDIKQNAITDQLQRAIEYCKNKGYSILLTADSNSHSKLWGNETNSRGRKWETFIENEQLIVHNQGRIPTFESKNGKSIIDVTLSYRLPIQLDNWRVLRKYNGTDHNSIHYSIKNMTIEIPEHRLYHRADWEQFRKILQESDINIPSEMTECKLDKMVNKLNFILNKALDNSCPTAKPKSIDCLLYTSPSPRDRQKSRMPSSA